ncbi:hypothetical protein EVAR_26484_1 [Eumeta japonica]|uniref:MADF domain-containing protein n=1 Tax=Eumeta variegata TaxID=151549 RepID=A0A4C1VBB2_EUMVA|nr:hypothetical protein EVAR_26484_1 [Eumeta japonica]
MARWDAEMNMKFLEEYRKHVCLWDPRELSYKHREAREVAYKSIADAMGMGMTVTSVIAKIRTLRNTYNNEILKAKKAAAKGKMYMSKIPWLPSMEFLKDIEPLTRKNNLDYFQNVVCIKAECSPASSPFREEHEDVPRSTPSPPPPPKEEKTHQSAKSPSPEADVVDEQETEFTSVQMAEQTENEFDLFGRIVSLQLQSLPLDVALETQELLMSVLRKQRVKVLRSQRKRRAADTSSSSS